MEKRIKITIPYNLAGKLSKKIKEAGFDKITSYVVYVLEQALSSEDSEEEEKNARTNIFSEKL